MQQQWSKSGITVRVKGHWLSSVVLLSRKVNYIEIICAMHMTWMFTLQRRRRENPFWRTNIRGMRLLYPAR